MHPSYSVGIAQEYIWDACKALLEPPPRYCAALVSSSSQSLFVHTTSHECSCNGLFLLIMSKKRSREEAGLTAEEEAQLLHAGQHTEGGFLQLQVSLILYANIV